MSDSSYYQTLGVEKDARQEEIRVAFEETLAARKARRARTSDVHAAFAVIGDVNQRRVYDLTRWGRASSERLSEAAELAIGVAREVELPRSC